MHSKDEPLFRVGSIYRDGYGDLVRILRPVGEDVAACIGFCGGRWDEYTFNFRLSDGKWLGSDLKERCDLIPGECDEQGNPIISDGLSDALSEQAKHLKADHPVLRVGPAKPETLGDLLRPYLSGEKQAVVHGKFTMTPTLDAMEADPNAAMIARDGPAKRCFCGDTITGGTRVVHRTEGPCYYAAEPSTAHPPIAGLMRENGFSHKLGSANEYRARAFRDGKWLPWHSITRQVYENRQRWPRDGYEVQAAPFVDDTAPSSIKPPIAGLTFLGPVTHQLGSAGKE